MFATCATASELPPRWANTPAGRRLEGLEDTAACKAINTKFNDKELRNIMARNRPLLGPSSQVMTKTRPTKEMTG